MRLRISIRGCVRPSVRPSVRPVLFSNYEKRHVPCSDDEDISHGLRESQAQFKYDIRMLVRQSVYPSDARKKERKKERKKKKERNKKKKEKERKKKKE